jgi:nucleoside-diphosphate-sugar epimerase
VELHAGGDVRSGATLLLTGATGFLGKVVLHDLLVRAEELGVERVYVVARPKRGIPADERVRSLWRSPALAGIDACLRERVTVIDADLAAETNGLEASGIAALLSRVTHVVHCAASVEFDLPVRRAHAANVMAALWVQELAQRLPRVGSLVSVSTAYVTPHAGDDVPIPEQLAPLPVAPEALHAALLAGAYDAPASEARLLAESGHPNTYTLTKALAEHLLVARARTPLSILRPSIIGGSLRRPLPGWTDSPAAFAQFVVMVGTGRMRAVIADPRTRLDLVPVDAVADRILQAAFDPPRAGETRIRHVVVGSDRSPTLRQCGLHVDRYFARHPLREGQPAAVRLRYLGLDGLRYRALHLFQHRLRSASRPVADRMAETNRRFAYFTHHSFRFEASAPTVGAEYEAAAYLDTACAGMHRYLLGGDRREVSLGGPTHPPASDCAWALRAPRGSAAIRVTAVLVSKALRRMGAHVTLDLESFEEARARVPADAALVLAPSHRSYLDFVLVSYLSFARPDLEIGVPAVAAAREFSRVPVLGRVLRDLGAFYLERGRGQEDKALTAAVHRVISEGRPLEFYVEGHRSRSRRFLSPRRGLLRSLQSTGRPIALLPLAITYDHVPEEATFAAELRGAPSPPMRLGDLLGWTRRLLRGELEIGRVHLACAMPVLLDLQGDVAKAADALVSALRGATVVTTHHLRAFLDRHPIAGGELSWLEREVRERGARVLRSPPRRGPVPDETERCLREHWRQLFLPEAALALPENPVVAFSARDAEVVRPDRCDAQAALSDPRIGALVRSIYTDPCRDWAALGRLLGPPPPGSEPPVTSPAEAARALPGAHLPDLEDAFEDLFARGILAREAGISAPVFGPRALGLEAWREACERLQP